VVAVDKAPLDPKVAAMPGVSWRGESAFALERHQASAPVDWLFSDIVCYPTRCCGWSRRGGRPAWCAISSAP
jgi:23S rRNA (cytidine2498-2'-O)-methyltransferase